MRDDAPMNLVSFVSLSDSQGFDVDDFSHSFACGRIEKMGFRGVIDDADKKELGEYSMEAIHKYNTDEVFS